MWCLLPSVAHALTLDQALLASDEASVEAQALREQTTQTEALRTKAWALVSPKLVGTGTYTYNEREIAFDTSGMIPDIPGLEVPPTEPMVIEEKDYLKANATLVQPLFSGQALPLLLAADATIDAARENERRGLQQLHAGVARAYYGLWITRTAVALADEAVATAEAQRRLAEVQVAAGLAPERARLQAEIAVSRATRDRAAAAAAEVQARQAFHHLTALDPTAPLEEPAPAARPESLEAAVATAYDHRGDLAAAEANARAAVWARRARWASFLPSVDGSFTYAWTQNLGFSDDPTMWVAMATATWTAWDGGMRVAEIRETSSQHRLAELAASRSVADVPLELETAWEALVRAEQALEAVEHEAALAEENRRLAELGFQAGTVTLLEVDQARLGVSAARLTRLQERAARDLALIDLHVAMGTYR